LFDVNPSCSKLDGKGREGKKEGKKEGRKEEMHATMAKAPFLCIPK